MVLLFCLTIPVGIGIGVGISNTYNENSQTAVIVEGILLSASAGILIFMALVDLLASDFIFCPKMLTSLKLQLASTSALLMGLILSNNKLGRWVSDNEALGQRPETRVLSDGSKVTAIPLEATSSIMLPFAQTVVVNAFEMYVLLVPPKP
ncbi:hypothetical protein K1719_002300 [Acacia pycnantha]|nr:hypothetical protein K1719_002300 [Acacia pycnantha]